MENRRNQKKKGNSIFPVLILLCLAVMGFSLYKIITISAEYRQGEKEYAVLQSYTTERNQEKKPAEQPNRRKQEENGSGETAEPVSGNEEAEEAAVPEENFAEEGIAPIGVDFQQLKAINPDLVCWLYIPVLELSYPVVQGADNDFYLHRTFEGSENFAGSLFVDAEIAHPFEDPHTIIYGHSMKNQTMFGKLKLLLQDDLLQQNPVFWILTENGEQAYQIISVSSTEAGSSVYTIFEYADEAFAGYMNRLFEQAGISSEELPGAAEECRLVTLSTCAAAEGTERLVVQGIAVN